MSTNTSQPEPSEEVDLGQLFKLIGNLFDRLFRFIGGIFNKLFLAFVWLVFFIKKHSIKLLIAGVIGFGYGLFKEKTSGPVYKMSALIKQNYKTGENLYNTIEYYNGLIAEGDMGTLAQTLFVDSVDVASITSFGVRTPVGENQKLLEYDEFIQELDSSIVSNLNYEDYLLSVEDYSYEMQEITIRSKSNSNFEQVFEGIISNIASNSHFKKEQEKDLKELTNQEIAIKQALTKSDSLQQTYKRVLEKGVNQENGAQTSITIEGSDEINKTKEYDLYRSDIRLRAELVQIEREKDDKQFILELVSNNRKKGVVDASIHVFGMSISPTFFFTLSIPCILFLILLIIPLIAYLEKFNNNEH